MKKEQLPAQFLAAAEYLRQELKKANAHIANLTAALSGALDEVDSLSNSERRESTEAIRKKFGIKTIAEIDEEFERELDTRS